MVFQTDIDRGGRALMDTFLQLSGIYTFYERHLELEIIKYPLPNHIAIVLDGNRRWASRSPRCMYSQLKTSSVRTKSLKTSTGFLKRSWKSSTMTSGCTNAG